MARLDRLVIEVAGADRIGFLQGLVSNDVAEARPGRAIYAALLTPQGRYVADFFIFATEAALLLDCAAAQAEQVLARLMRFRLRAAVSVGFAAPPWHVVAAWDGSVPFSSDALVAPDPRCPMAGLRALVRAIPDGCADEAAYDAHRLALGLPDGMRDMEADRTLLLEAGFDALNAISWTKGCYMGQELTARTRYRGLVKRMILPVVADGALPPPGSLIEAEGREVGILHAGRGRRAMATLRLDALEATLSAAGAGLRLVRPAWLSTAPELERLVPLHALPEPGIEPDAAA